jgi:flagellar biogenesis protein FliO
MADTNVATTKDLPSPEPVLFSMVRLMGALVLVFAVLFFGVWAFRNWQRLILRRSGPAKLHILEVKSLGPRQAIYLVGYEKQRFLIASSPEGISLLTPLPEAQTDAAPPTPPPSAAPSSFTDVLNKVMNRKTPS